MALCRADCMYAWWMVGGGEIGLRGDSSGAVVAVVASIEVPVVGAAAVAAMAGVAAMGRAIPVGVEVEAIRTVIFGDSVWIRRFRGIQCFPLLSFVVRKCLFALLVKEVRK